MPTTPTPAPAPLPMAVWPTAPASTEPVDLSTTIPALLAQRLIAVYTHPGDTVHAAGVGAPVVTAVARELGRHPTPTHTTTISARARLVVLTLGAVSTDPTHLAGWNRRLLPAGLLAAVVPNTAGAGATLCGRLVDAARQAGLGYLQHVVALTARLADDRLDPHPTNRDLDHALATRASGLPAHLPVHADVLILQHTAPTASHDTEVAQ